MRSFRSRPVGWRGESHRHYLASKGVSTTRFVKSKSNKYYSKVDDIISKQKEFSKHSEAVSLNGDINAPLLLDELNGFRGELEGLDLSLLTVTDRVKVRDRVREVDHLIGSAQHIKDHDAEFAEYNRAFEDDVGAQERVSAVKRVDADGKPLPKDAYFDEETGRYYASKDNAIKWIKAPLGVKYDFYGIDSKGRRVRRYGKVHSDKASSSKFSRIARLNKKYDEIESTLKKEVDVKDVSKRENARATYVILKTGLRPGSAKDTKADVEASGLTTLNDDEVVVSGSTSRFRFVGKKGVNIDKSVSDPTLARIVKEQKRLKGDDLFPNISDSSVRGYVRKFGKFKTKDFRTLYANKLAKGLVSKGVPKKQVVAKVADELQNTPSVASGSYIDPKVFS